MAIEAQPRYAPGRSGVNEIVRVVHAFRDNVIKNLGFT